MLEFRIDWCRKFLVLKWESGWLGDSQGQEYASDVVQAGSLNYVVIYESKSPMKRTSSSAFTRRVQKICAAIYYLVSNIII